MLPRLEAGETLARATAAMLGAGTMRRRDAARYLASLQRAIDGATQPAPRQPPNPAALAAIGIAVVEAPFKAASSGLQTGFEGALDNG